MSTAVTVKGQVTLPKDVRDKVGIKPGDRVEVRATAAGTVVIEKVSDTAISAREPIERAIKSIHARGGILSDMTADEIMAMTRGVE